LRQNSTLSFIATFTAHLVQHVLHINVHEILPECGLAERFARLAALICCVFFYLVYLMRRSQFQLLFIALLMASSVLFSNACVLLVFFGNCFLKARR